MVQFIGHLHPLLVHLPIGGLILAGLLELLALGHRYRSANQSNLYLLVLSAVAGLAAAGCGWLLAGFGDYAGPLLTWHRWTGLGLEGALIFTCWTCRRKCVLVYRISLAVTLALLGFTGHFGGSLTHGEGFLTRFIPFWSTPATSAAVLSLEDLMGRDVASQVVLPILRRRCGDCHGAAKRKGGLRLDRLDDLFEGGTSGPAVVESNAPASLLIRRLFLPPEDEEHMPPPGKPQPTPGEIALLRWWIDAGAPTNATATSLKPSAETERLLQGAFKTLRLR